jgi:hypothetical protein
MLHKIKLITVKIGEWKEKTIQMKGINNIKLKFKCENRAMVKLEGRGRGKGKEESMKTS